MYKLNVNRFQHKNFILRYDDGLWSCINFSNLIYTTQEFICFHLKWDQENMELIIKVDLEDSVELTPERINAVRQLWADQGMKECYERRREFQLSDSSKQ